MDALAEAGSEESIEIKVTKNESEEELEVPESGSEIEVDTNQEYRNEYSEEDESVEPSPEREVFIKESKSADRNKRRRYRRKVTRDQEKKHVTERIDATHPKMRLGKEATKNTRKRSRTPSTEILSDDDEDVQDTKVPKNKKKNRRQ